MPDLFAALSEHPSPQQRGERPGVRQVRAGVDADQHREHGVRAGQGRRGQQDEQRRDVVERVGEGGGEEGGAEQREQAAAAREHVGDDVGEARVGERPDDQAQAEHEREQWHVDRLGARDDQQRADRGGPRDVDVQRPGGDEPGEREREDDQRALRERREVGPRCPPGRFEHGR